VIITIIKFNNNLDEVMVTNNQDVVVVIITNIKRKYKLKNKKIKRFIKNLNTIINHF